MHISIKSDILFSILGFPVTNTMLTAWVVLFFVIVASFIIRKNIKKNPGKFQALLEIILEKFMDFMGSFAGDMKLVRKFLPIVLTIFLFILFSNWAGTIPGVESIGIHKEDHGHEVFVPLFRTVNSDINMTLALALIVVVGSHIVGLVTIGAKHHLSKFFVNPFKNPIGTFVGILEFIGEFSRVVSLTFRLFGNIFAGSVLMLIVTHLTHYIIPVPFLGLELFVGFIQALVFAVLAMMFFASATHTHHEEAH